ncbi:MAG TPA: alpha/beta hydrolase [Dehalococcoidia bacterium]|nr:alpha/beta hydrolase [Dehalococcoidia bacterium]
MGLGLATGTVVGAGWRWVRPLRWPDPPTLRGHEFRFPSLDGTSLRGLWLEGQPGRGALVLCHGYFRSLAEPYEVGLFLNSLGYHVLLFDFRGCGKSGGRYTTLGAKEVLDVLAAVRQALDRGAGRVALLGISMGASASIMAAAREPRVMAVIADSPYADLAGLLSHRLRTLLPLSPLRPLGRASMRLGELLAAFRVGEVRPVDFVGAIAPRPLLLVYGERDTFVPPEQREELWLRAGEPKERWTAPGSDHAMARLDYPEQYRELLRRFLGRYFP